jgi:Protein  of unknown function (DUF3018)
MRPIQIWVPDVQSPEFAAEARRQSLLANASPEEAEIQAFIDSVTVWLADDDLLRLNRSLLVFLGLAR